MIYKSKKIYFALKKYQRIIILFELIVILCTPFIVWSQHRNEINNLTILVAFTFGLLISLPMVVLIESFEYLVLKNIRRAGTEIKRKNKVRNIRHVEEWISGVALINLGINPFEKISFEDIYSLGRQPKEEELLIQNIRVLAEMVEGTE